MKKLKVGDIFIYVFLGIFALVGFLGMKSMVATEGERSVVVLLDGQEIERIPLKQDMEPMKVEADDGKGNYNIIYITYADVHIVEANCKDSLCIKQGSIKNPGQSIVCLPNKLVIKIIGEDTSSPVDDVTSLGGQLCL